MCKGLMMSRSQSALLNVLVVLTIRVFFLTSASKFNVSVTDLSTCEEYRLQSSYEYRNFFLIENLQNNPKSGELLRLKFYVMTTKDAHILLSTKDKPKKNDSVYEIVIGAGGNTFSTLRRNIGTTRLAFNSQTNVLTPVDPTPIEVQQTSDGRINVIISGLPEPYLTYQDKDPLIVKYVSFSTFGNTPARWFYDCKMDEQSNQLEMEKRNLTNGEQLQQDLFQNYSVYMIPENLKNIWFSFKVNGMNYDEQNSILRTRIQLKMEWQDNKLRWQPERYGGLDVMLSSDLSTAIYHWSPTIMINNGAGYTYHDFNPTYMGLIFSNGTIKVRSVQEIIDTWCIESSHDWPFDDLKCDIMLAVQGSGIKLVHDNTSPVDGNEQISELSQWHLNAISVAPNTTTQKGSTTKNDLFISLKLRRNQVFYQKVFVAPIVGIFCIPVACMTLILSFCADGFIRGGLNLFVTLFTALTFMLISSYAPVTHVPKLVHVYEAVMVTSCFTYFLHIITEWLVKYPPSLNPPKCIAAIIRFSALRATPFSHSADYVRIQKQPWKEVSKLLNTLCCCILFIFFVRMLFVIRWI